MTKDPARKVIPGACLVVKLNIQEGVDDATQEKGQACHFILERYREHSISEVKFSL